MKKLLILGMFSVVAMFPLLTSAQTTAPAFTVESLISQIEELKKELLIQQLLVQIADLKNQIAQILAAQNATGGGSVSSNSPTETIGAPAAVAPQFKEVKIGIGNAICSPKLVSLPISVQGPWASAVGRLYSDNGFIDIRSGLNPRQALDNPNYTLVVDNSEGSLGALHYEVTAYGKSICITQGNCIKEVFASESGVICNN